AEPIITLGKSPTLSNRRLALSRLRDKEVVYKLFNELGPRYAKRPGGYLRILKFGFRLGDNAPMALVELMDRPEPAAQVEGGAEAGEKKAAAGNAPKKTKAGPTAKTAGKGAQPKSNAKKTKAAAGA